MADIDHRVAALEALDIPGVFVRDDDTSPVGDRMIQEAQVHALLDVAAAIRERTEAERSNCGHGTVGVCMSCLRDALTGAV